MDRETRIQLCGRLVVKLQGRRLEDALPGRQGRLVFAHLVLSRALPISRDHLIEVLWPDGPPSAPGIALRALLSKLRRVLGVDVVSGGDEPRLVLPPEAFVDFEAATLGAHRAEAAVAAGDWSRAYGPARVSAYTAERGFLPAQDGPWVEERRRELADIAVRAHECCVVVGLALGGSELAVGEGHARRVVELSPYRESGYRLLMQVLEAQGNAAEACRVYDRLRCLLRDELGIAPDPSVQELHARLLRGTAAASPA